MKIFFYIYSNSYIYFEQLEYVVLKYASGTVDRLEKKKKRRNKISLEYSNLYNMYIMYIETIKKQ